MAILNNPLVKKGLQKVGTAIVSSVGKAVQAPKPAPQSSKVMGISDSDKTRVTQIQNTQKSSTPSTAQVEAVKNTVTPTTPKVTPVTPSPQINNQVAAVTASKEPEPMMSGGERAKTLTKVTPENRNTYRQQAPGTSTPGVSTQAQPATSSVTTAAQSAQQTPASYNEQMATNAQAAATTAPATLEQQRDAVRQAYLNSLQVGSDEARAKDEVARLNAEANAAITNIDATGSQRGFTTGYATGLQGAIARQADSAKLPLEARIANLQAQRNAEQQAAQANLGFIQSDIQAQQTANKEAQTTARQDQEAKRNILMAALQGGATQEQMAQILGAASVDEALQIAAPFLSQKQQKDLVEVSGGATLYDPNTGQPVYTAPDSGGSSSLPNSAKEYEYARSQGYTGDYMSFQNSQNAKAPTVEQSKARDYYANAQNAMNALNQINYNPGLIESNLVPNALKGENRQQFEQASRAFVNSVLRRESGATITDDEFNNKYKELIPQAGDKAATLEQKRIAREAAVNSLFQATGQDADPLGLFSNAQTQALNGSNDAKRIAAAIKQVESGGNYNARGASTEGGAYQFMPASWSQWAGQYLGDPNAPMTPENQDYVAEAKIQDLLNQGYGVEQIALIWNGGQPIVKKGVNKYGVAYDSGAYANKVVNQYGRA